jgi:hypothetical protein
MERLRRIAVVVGVSAALALPLTAAATVSVSKTVSDDGDYRVSWTDTSSGNIRLYLRYRYNSVSTSSTRVTGPSYRDYSRMAVGTHSYYIDAYEYEPELGRTFFLYRTPTVTVTVTEKRDYVVGVLAGSTECASGSPATIIKMDNEDACDTWDHSCWGEHSEAYGWTGASYVDGAGNATFYFCPVDGTALKPLTPVPDYTKEYVVLKLSDYCPNGSSEFGRFFDNEDTDTANWSSGNVYPNYQAEGYNWMLRFCVFRYGADVAQPDPVTGLLFPSFGFSYGVFAPESFYYAVSNSRGYIFTDDEDDTPIADYFDIPAPLDQWSVYNIIDGYPHAAVFGFSGDTILRTAQVVYQ